MATATFLKSLDELERQLGNPGPDWLHARRREARGRFDEHGLPTARDEEWRNTNLAPITGTRFETLRGPLEAPREFPGREWLGDEALHLTFVNGAFVGPPPAAQELPDGVWIGSLARALEQIPERLRAVLGTASAKQRTAFESLNTAFLRDGAVVLVPQGVQLESPIQLTYLSVVEDQPVLFHPRTLVLAGRDSRVSLFELFTSTSEATYLTNAVTEVHVEDNASVEHVRVQLESESGYHLSTSVSRQGRDSRYTHHNLDFGGRLVRHDLRAILDGPGAYCDLLGVYVTRGRQHVDNHTVLDHAKPNCGSRELYKGVLDGKSRTVFTGRIIVREDAQKTDAKQSNQNLVLSNDALAHTRPQLEIYADDVKCTHGATVGRLDEEAVFYLRSRAIPERQARNMMIRAFADEALERVGSDALRQALKREVSRRLPGDDG